MRVKINRIQASILDTSTHEEESCMIDFWKIQYEIIMYNPYLHNIQGEISLKDLPTIPNILLYIKKHYVDPESKK